MQSNGLTFLDYAFRVLSETQAAMTPDEIWTSEPGEKLKSQMKTNGKTPLATLAARLYVDAKNRDSRFSTVGSRPVRFAIKGVTLSKTPSEPQKNPEDSKRKSFLEKDLHPLLVWFARQEFSAWCKTIPHSKSIRQSEKQNQWLHPDIVGFTLLSGDWSRPVADLLQKTGASAAKLYSFELKCSLDFGTLREYFFQAVSNSSWANAGYLVTAELTETPEFMEELGRLSQSFGIGVIKLNLEDIEESKIVFAAREKTELDWETINRLARLNPVFDEFLTLVGESISLNKIVNETKFDKAEDPDTIAALTANIMELSKL